MLISAEMNQKKIGIKENFILISGRSIVAFN